MSSTKLVASSLFLVFIFQNLAAQQLPARPQSSDPPVQSGYVELGGTGIGYSVNYDAIFSNGWGIRIGGGYLPEERRRGPFSGERHTYLGTEILTVIIMGEYVTGKGPHKFESAAGVVLGETNLDDSWIDPPALPGLALSFGYRLLPEEPGKLTVKVAYTPVISGKRLFNSFGISLGLVIGGSEDDKIR